MLSGLIVFIAAFAGAFLGVKFSVRWRSGAPWWPPVRKDFRNEQAGFINPNDLIVHTRVLVFFGHMRIGKVWSTSHPNRMDNIRANDPQPVRWSIKWVW